MGLIKRIDFAGGSININLPEVINGLDNREFSELIKDLKARGRIGDNIAVQKGAKKSNAKISKVFAETQEIINVNPKLAGFAYDMKGGGLFSKNADDFYLLTKHGDNNHTICQNPSVMLGGKNYIDNCPEAKGKAGLAAIVAGPAVGITDSSYAQVVRDVEFGESAGAVCMYYFYDLKSGKVFRLIEDENAWLSLGDWYVVHVCAAQRAVAHTARNLVGSSRLADVVREQLRQRVQGGR